MSAKQHFAIAGALVSFPVLNGGLCVDTPKWEVGDVAVFKGYSNVEDRPLFKVGDNLVIVEISTNNPHILMCIKLTDYHRFLAEDPDLVGDEVWDYEVRRPNAVRAA